MSEQAISHARFLKPGEWSGRWESNPHGQCFQSWKTSALARWYQLQRLLREQQSIRFEYLLTARHLDCSRFESLDAIAERLEAGWSDAEESALRTLDARYNKISLEIADIRSKWKPYAVGESSKMLENDPEYQTARLALSSRAKEFAERVKR
jgi:hypothetical protein